MRRVTDPRTAAINRLVEHASGLDVAGFADAVSHHRTAGAVLDLEALWTEIVPLFQALVEETPRSSAPDLPLPLAYAVAEIQGKACLLAIEAASAEERYDRCVFAWRTATAWEAVLAGDIDDIADHVATEANARLGGA